MQDYYDGGALRHDIAPFITDEMLACIRRFSCSSAGEGSAFTITHLRELLSTSKAHENGGLLHALCALCTRWAGGNAAPELAEWIAGAPVIPLKKPNGDVRLIAVGETLRRITASLLIVRNVDAIHALLAPHQLVVATQNGAEAITHGI